MLLWLLAALVPAPTCGIHVRAGAAALEPSSWVTSAEALADSERYQSTGASATKAVRLYQLLRGVSAQNRSSRWARIQARLQAKLAAGVALSESFGRSLPRGSNCSKALEALPPRKGAGNATVAVAEVPNASLLIVNVGMGTTGTRSLHNEMCAWNLSSLHFKQNCHARENTLRLHADILRIYGQLKDCAGGVLHRTDPRCRAAPLRRQLLRQLTALVASGVQVLSDVPYANLAPVLLRMVPGLRVVQTLRDPSAWAKKRLNGSRGQGKHVVDVICKDPVALGGQSPFDLLGCLNGAEWVADAFEPLGRHAQRGQNGTYRAESLTALGAKFAQHNVIVANLTRPANLRQLCAWDRQPDFDGQLDVALLSLAAPMLASTTPRPQNASGSGVVGSGSQLLRRLRSWLGHAGRS